MCRMRVNELKYNKGKVAVIGVRKKCHAGRNTCIEVTGLAIAVQNPRALGCISAARGLFHSAKFCEIFSRAWECYRLGGTIPVLIDQIDTYCFWFSLPFSHTHTINILRYLSVRSGLCWPCMHLVVSKVIAVTTTHKRHWFQSESGEHFDTTAKFVEIEPWKSLASQYQNSTKGFQAYHVMTRKHIIRDTTHMYSIQVLNTKSTHAWSTEASPSLRKIQTKTEVFFNPPTKHESSMKTKVLEDKSILRRMDISWRLQIATGGADWNKSR